MTMAVGEWTTICMCGERRVSVEPEAVIGPYAVHLSIGHLVAAGPGYTITHRPTGLAIWHVRKFTDGVRVATWLDAEKVLPETEAGMLLWKEALTPTVCTYLMARLAAIAPREQVLAE